MRKLCLLVAAWPLCAAETSYFREVRPLVERHCQGCHQPNLKSGNLDLTTYQGLMAGGKHGPAAPLLVKYLTGELKPVMPLGQPPLAATEIATVRAWVEGGAKDDTPKGLEDSISATKPPVYHQAPVVTALAFSPDGKTLAVSGNREVLLHSLDGGPLRRLVGQSDRILSIAFSRDGSKLLAGGGTPARFGELQLWNLADGKLMRSVMLSTDTVFGASLSPDATRAAAGGTDNTVRIVDLQAGKELYKVGSHENWVLGTLFDSTGKRVISVGRDRAAKLTETASGAFLENVNLLRSELNAVARHPAKDIIVIGGDDRIPYVYLVDRPKNMKIADDTTLIRKLDRQKGAIQSLAWSANGKWIAVAGAAPEVHIYDAETGKLAATCTGHAAGIYTIAFSPDSATLATAGFDGQVRLYDAASGKLRRAFVPVPLETPELRSAR